MTFKQCLLHSSRVCWFVTCSLDILCHDIQAVFVDMAIGPRGSSSAAQALDFASPQRGRADVPQRETVGLVDGVRTKKILGVFQ